MYEREQYTIKLIFDNEEEATTTDIAQLFSILSRANDVAQELSAEDSESTEMCDLVVNKISLNSPLTIELIATGLGTAYLLIQILDRGSKFLLERQKLKLEVQKLKSEPNESKVPQAKSSKIEEIQDDLERLMHKLKSLEVESSDEEKG